MGQGYGEETAVLSDWNAGDYTDIFDQQKTNVDDKSALATNIAAAIGRREDQLILDALDAANAAASVGVGVGGADSGLNMAKLRAAKRVLDARAVPQKDRYFVHSAIGLEQLLGMTEVTSADFNAVRTLANGEVKTFLGFNFVMIEDREEGGLALRDDLHTAEDAVVRLVQVKLTDGQFGALVSLVFNIGAGAFARSTLLKRLNAGDYTGARGRHGGDRRAECSVP